ncbi:Hypothetical protein PHPALM_12058 [Phytophthora palmivora]|uniref:BED-type domain-containing protein n=1 Tax=Phytophthora palmivora TaxID=4796 RepID=A0A2P4Y0Q5_9STRA|nr:Hypothetical protein PHPALM_12058 [Phytophthora palmivora]
MPTSRAISTLFFTDCGDGLFSCKQCDEARKQTAGTGYTNLISHLKIKHPGYNEIYEYTTIKPVSSKPLVRYMRHVAVKVGERISQDMSDALGLMFDGQTCGTHHFVAIFGVFAKESKLQYILLAVSPAEFGQTDDAHIVMIGTVLEL